MSVCSGAHRVLEAVSVVSGGVMVASGGGVGGGSIGRGVGDG